MSTSDPLVLLAVSFAAASSAILLWYLVRRPALVWPTKVLLLFGLGAFPLATATTGNVAGFHQTKTRGFCGGCHVMEPFTGDVADPTSLTLAARHSRNPSFGGESCYAC